MLECKVYAANDLRVLEVPVPTPQAGEVLVRLGAAGICGSDIAISSSDTSAVTGTHWRSGITKYSLNMPCM